MLFSNKTIIIAEAGVNHNGDIYLARDLICEAAAAKADYIKFQTFSADKLASKDAKLANYQKQSNNPHKSQYDMLKKLELTYEMHLELIEHCKKNKIKFLSSPFDIDSLEMLIKLGIDFIKIPSGEITNFPLLRHVSSLNLPVVMSTGMSNVKEIEDALNVLLENELTKKDISILQCNTQYPTPMADVNLLAIQFLSEYFGIRVGYSDHTKGTEVPIAAVALGANIIEKHFTIDKSLPGPDHKASLDSSELKSMIQAIRNIEIAMGKGEKKLTDSEINNALIARKSIVASTNISKGERFTEINLAVKRPANGISPMRWKEVIGQLATKDFKKDEPISL